MLKEESIPLFVLFVLFGQAKRTLEDKYHKETFLLSYFCMTKSTKSHLRGLSSLLKNTLRVHELVARAMRGECVRQRGNAKVGGFTAPRNLNYTTRANISHEEAEQIRARIVCTPAYKGVAGVNPVPALTELSNKPSSCYVRTHTRTTTPTARFAVVKHGTVVNPNRRLSVSNL